MLNGMDEFFGTQLLFCHKITWVLEDSVHFLQWDRDQQAFEKKTFEKKVVDNDHYEMEEVESLKHNSILYALDTLEECDVIQYHTPDDDVDPEEGNILIDASGLAETGYITEVKQNFDFKMQDYQYEIVLMCVCMLGLHFRDVQKFICVCGHSFLLTTISACTVVSVCEAEIGTSAFASPDSGVFGMI